MTHKMPTFDSLMNPLLDALFTLGGSGSIDEIYEKVLEQEKISEKIASVPHNPEKSNQTEIAYRLAWARTYLKKYGFLENSSRGVWTLTKLAKDQKNVIPHDVIKQVREVDKAESKPNSTVQSFNRPQAASGIQSSRQVRLFDIIIV
jgi:restriction system protein